MRPRLPGGRALSRVALGWIVLLTVTALGAGVLSPFDPHAQVDSPSSAGRPPLTRLWTIETTDRYRVLVVDRVSRADERVIAERRGEEIELATSEVRSVARRSHWLGTDQLGRDLLSRLIHGARTSLLVGVLSAALSLALGVLVGATAALGGRWVDLVLMRLVDGVLAFPALLLVLSFALLFDPGVWSLIALIGFTGSLSLARLTRAELLVLQGQPFVEAVRSLGGGPLRLFFVHLLPNAASPLLVATSLAVADAILMEATVSFLGLGVGSSLPSWGRVIWEGSADLARLWWVSTFPGLLIVATALAFNSLADRVRDVLDPATRGAERALHRRPRAPAATAPSAAR
ncbi:MAG TPA: ABC transporter permease [Thermoanaerobaculia bacterium]|nr:ABC transporter permease [Thermoanaerobaculia bacterium]